MPDKRINDLVADPANPDIARDDLVLIQRGGVDRPATLDGALLLPAYNPVSDVGKTLQIDSSGNVIWERPATTAYTRLASLTTGAPTSPVAIAGVDLTGYRDIRLLFGISGDDDGVRVVDVPAGVPRGYSADAKIQAWILGTSRIGFEFFTPDPGDIAAPQSLVVYGRR